MKCKYCPYKFTKTQYKYSSIHILHICSTEPLSVTFIKKCKTEILTWELEGKLSEKNGIEPFMFNIKCLLIFYQNLKYVQLNVQLICKTQKCYPENFIVSYSIRTIEVLVFLQKNILKNQTQGIITSLVYVQLIYKTNYPEICKRRYP